MKFSRRQELEQRQQEDLGLRRTSTRQKIEETAPFRLWRRSINVRTSSYVEADIVKAAKFYAGMYKHGSSSSCSRCGFGGFVLRNRRGCHRRVGWSDLLPRAW